tara:strand:- start:51 stop:635 length:585 start_codon:yes stop_codon:yes gene_type:complete
VIINHQKLKRTLAKQVPPVLSKKIFNNLEKEFERAKQKLLQDFENHAVSKELDGREGASNISNTLGGEGNLYSFIGFSGEDALSQLRDLLTDGIKIINKTTDGNNLTFSIKIAIPTTDAIASATPMPWAPGISWAEGIEKGISGLGNFLNKRTSASRSGRGIQLDYKVRGETFSGVPYLTKILEDFISELTKLK